MQAGRQALIASNLGFMPLGFWTAGSAEASGSRQHVDSEGAGIDFGEMGRPTKASYTTTSGVKGSITFDYLVDASGRNGLLSTRYAKYDFVGVYMRC